MLQKQGKRGFKIALLCSSDVLLKEKTKKKPKTNGKAEGTKNDLSHRVHEK